MDSNLKLATAIVKRNIAFAEDIQQYGHTMSFEKDNDEKSSEAHQPKGARSKPFASQPHTTFGSSTPFANAVTNFALGVLERQRFKKEFDISQITLSLRIFSFQGRLFKNQIQGIASRNGWKVSIPIPEALGSRAARRPSFLWHGKSSPKIGVRNRCFEQY